jgi:arylsulfatase A-like enzyme
VHAPFQGRRDLLEKFKGQGFEGRELEHAAMVGAVDDSIGRIREALDKRGIAGNTLLLFVGDQGGPFKNTPLRGGKQGGTACYEGGARIPFMVNWPGVVKPGISDVPVLTDDVFPTLLEAAGGRISSCLNLDGKSLIPLLKRTGSLDRKEVYIYRSYEDQYAAIRSGNLKMIAYRSGKTELYDIKEDISETFDLSAKMPGMVAEMKEKLLAWEKNLGLDEISGCK